MNGCVACNGPMVLLGRLGNREHYRCRNCGLDQSHIPQETWDCCDGEPLDLCEMGEDE